MMIIVMVRLKIKKSSNDKHSFTIANSLTVLQYIKKAVYEEKK
jgi:hypothetical protein